MTFNWRERRTGRSPLTIAHRGGAALAAENTAAAFAAAALAGADAMETDVRSSADGALVCLHDADLRRLYADPRRVADLDLATLRGLVPGLMTLDEAIAASAPLGILLDVKLADSRRLADIIAAVGAGEATERAILGLRDMQMIVEARRMSGNIAILGLLPDPDSAGEAARLGADWFRLWQGEASPDRVATARGAGLQVAVMVGQPRNVPLPHYPQFAVGLVDGKGLERLRQLAPDAVMLDDPRLLRM